MSSAPGKERSKVTSSTLKTLLHLPFHTALSLSLQQILINIITLPYYRFFRQNSLFPILAVAGAKNRDASARELTRLLANWRRRKVEELRFVGAASTLLAAAVIGSFSWSPLPDESWLGPAFWYASLVLSILAILLSSSHAFLFTALGEPDISDYEIFLDLVVWLSVSLDDVDDGYIIGQRERGGEREGGGRKRNNGPGRGSGRDRGTWRPRWKMLFTWQCPMMFMAYSVCFFLAGLCVYVCTPLFKGDVRSGGGKTGIFFLVVSAVAGGLFIYCSYWASRFVDFERSVDAGQEVAVDKCKCTCGLTKEGAGLGMGSTVTSSGSGSGSQGVGRVDQGRERQRMMSV